MPKRVRGVDTDPIYSTHEVAARLGLHPNTVRRYVRDGRLQATIYSPTHWRYSEAAIQGFIAAQNTQVA